MSYTSITLYMGGGGGSGDDSGNPVVASTACADPCFGFVPHVQSLDSLLVTSQVSSNYATMDEGSVRDLALWNSMVPFIDVPMSNRTPVTQPHFYGVVHNDSDRTSGQALTETVTVGMSANGAVVVCDWDSARPMFARYRDEGLKLKEIMDIMTERHKFSAPIHKWKRMITRWGLEKSSTSSEKTKHGTMAQRLLATGEPLPLRDEFGRMIPWDKVRRQFGRHIIPKKAIPSIPNHEQSDEVDYVNGSEEDGLVADCSQCPSAEIDTRIFSLKNAWELDSLRSSGSSLYRPEVETMFYHASNFYAQCWHIGQMRRDHEWSTKVVGVYNAVFQKVAVLPRKKKTRLLYGAAVYALDAIRQRSDSILGDIFRVLQLSHAYTDFRETLLLLGFFVASCRQELGSSDPLTEILLLMYEQLQNWTGSQVTGVEILLDTVTQMSKFSARERLALNHSASVQFEVRRIHFHSLGDKAVGDGPTNLMSREAMDELEQISEDFLRWTTNTFGPTSDERRYIDLWLTYYRGVFYPEITDQAREKLERLWTMWIHRLQTEGPQLALYAFSVTRDWCPAWAAELLCKKVGDLYAAAYYSYEDFRWLRYRYDFERGTTLYALNSHIRCLNRLKEYGTIDSLKFLYPESCSLLRRSVFEDDDSESVYRGQDRLDHNVWLERRETYRQHLLEKSGVRDESGASWDITGSVHEVE